MEITNRSAQPTLKTYLPLKTQLLFNPRDVRQGAKDIARPGL